MGEWAITAEGLGKTYRDQWIGGRRFRALDNLTLQVSRGAIFGLLGPNGAGKTTFIKILLGIIGRSEGKASVLGEPAGSRACRRQIGYLPEQMRVPRHLTGRAALAYYGSLSGMNRREVKRRSDELLELVGLGDRGKDLTRKYSKGMLQRLGLAQALLHEPPVLILDEPTDGLDPRARAEMRAILERLRSERGTTIFLNSHILQEVELVCDDVAILHRGRLRYCGPVSEVESRLRTESGVRDTLRIEMAIQGSTDAMSAFAATISGAVVRPGDTTVIECTADTQGQVDAWVDSLRAAGISLVGLSRSRVSLEDAFLTFTSSEEHAA